MQKVGVFDSGIGGKSVALAIERAMPEVEVTFVNDTKNVPYGTKSPKVLFDLVLPILKKLAQDVDVIVVACNTISTTLIHELRAQIKVPMIALEPMIKPAAQTTKSDTIAVCATPTTLASKRYHWLKEAYAPDIHVLEPDCSDWSAMIETNTVDHNKIRERISAVCEQGADVIVLGCTHYHWIEEEIKQIASEYGADVIQPEQAIVAQLRRVLQQQS